MKAFDVLHSRRAMYLMPYEKKVDAASFFVNFLIAIFDSQELGAPESVHITSAGPYFSIQANGCHFPESIDSVASLFDIANYRQPFFDELYSLGFIRPLVLFSEYCLLDITCDGQLFQQAFLQGAPLGENPALPLHGQAAKIGLWFTLPAKIFEDVTLDFDRLQRVLTAWEKGELAPLLEGETRVILQKEWSKHSTTHHSLRLSVNGTITAIQPVNALGSEPDQTHPSEVLALATT